ncbi:MAG: M13 family metallopeptidase [Bacteroidetes bacterium]|nr:M13 family metallopeptidase [Bacteroidota bacterium]
MKKTRYYFFFISIIILSISFPVFAQKTPTISSDPLAAHIDSSINPGDDFFMYANGKWFKKNPIPPNEKSCGLWEMIQATINDQIRKICESSATMTQVAKGPNRQKIGDFYFSGMDSLSINRKGLSVLKKEIYQIESMKDLNDLMVIEGMVDKSVGSNLFNFFLGQDFRISSKYALFIRQGGISLPSSNYYFDTDSKTTAIRQRFIAYATGLYQNMGYQKTAAEKAGAQLMKLETDLARISRTKEQLRNTEKNFTKLSLNQLQELTPNMNWTVFMQSLNLHQVDTVIVGQPEFFKGLDKLLRSVSLKVWKDYFKFRLVNSLTAYLDDKLYNDFFSFYYTTLRGVETPKPRWERVVEKTNKSLGELVGQVYVDEYLPKGSKEKLTEIGTSIKEVFIERIKNLDWMSPGAKMVALKKLSTMRFKVGAPDKWKDLSTMKINRSSYAQNVMNANRWAHEYMISKYGKPIDNTEWNMTPQTYSAYYDQSNNEVCVPGCNIIIPGFEKTMADDALLYSIIGGSTFGHEITHAFDDQGRKYDEYGNMHNWWTDNDSAYFHKKTKTLADQYNRYIAVDTLHLNGSLTLGENIADLGGLRMGYEAFKKTHQFITNEVIEGLSAEKRFFLGWAYAWMINERPEIIALSIKSNSHSPARYRVLGPLSNTSEFYKAFGLKKENKMWIPEEMRVTIW